MLIRATESVAINLLRVENISIQGRYLCFEFSTKDREIQVGLYSNENAKLAFAHIFECAENGNAVVDISNY